MIKAAVASLLRDLTAAHIEINGPPRRGPRSVWRSVQTPSGKTPLSDLSLGYAKRPPPGFVQNRLHASLTKNERTVDVTANGTVGRLAQQLANPSPTAGGRSSTPVVL
jgi:hypothetical protein